jgi:hypothetical protein
MAAFPENIDVDLHDVAALILDALWQSDTRLPTSKLVEILHAESDPRALPNRLGNLLHPEWFLNSSTQKVAYFVKYPTPGDEEASDSAPVSIDAFLHPELEETSRPTSRKEIEEIYWRCKLFNNGYLATYVAQQTLLALPASTNVHARTSTGFQISFKPGPATITVNELSTMPKKPCMILNYCMRSDISDTTVDREIHMTGFQPSTAWVYLLLGPATSTDLEEDQRVILDLAIAEFGGRGGGGELFAMEKGSYYHWNVLPSVAHELEGEMKLSQLMVFSDPALRAKGDEIVQRVLQRLKAVVVDGADNFCRYCGKGDVGQRCSKCKKAFCPACHRLGWKYHKKWCA